MLDSRETEGGTAVMERPEVPHLDMRTVAVGDIGKGVNPRAVFDPNKLQDLTDSIRLMGIIEPIVLRVNDDHESLADGASPFSIIAGERRFRAAQAAGLADVPAIIRRCTETEALEMALEENIQREQLNAIEEAQGFAMLMMAGRTQHQIGERLGKSQPFIANRLRLLQLPEEVQKVIADGTLSVSHGISLAAVAAFPDAATSMMRQAVAESLSVKALDDLAQTYKVAKEREQQPAMELSPPAEAEKPPDKQPDRQPEPAAYVGPEPAPVPDGDGDPVAEEPAPPAEPVEVRTVETETAGEPDAEGPPTEPVAQAETDPGSEVQPAPAKAASPAPSPVAVTDRRSSGSSAVQDGAPTPPSPTGDARAGLPAGYVRAIVKEADYLALKDEGIWPLDKVRSALAGKPAEAPAPASTGDLPAGLTRAIVKLADYDALKERGLWPLDKVLTALDAAPAPAGKGRADDLLGELVKLNDNDLSVLTSPETDLLDDLFPGREHTTAEHILEVLLKQRLNIMREAVRRGESEAARLKESEA